MSMPLAHIQSTLNVTLLLCFENLIMSIYLVAIPRKCAATGEIIKVG